METEKPKLFLDIYDLCSILHTVGFVITDGLQCNETRPVGRSITITCNVSGKTVHLESSDKECFCWRHAGQEDIEKWEMSGTSGGKQTTKMESSTSLWKELPKNIVSSIGKTLESLIEIVRGSPISVSTPKKDKKKALVLDNINAKLDQIKSRFNALEGEPNHQISRSSSNIDISPPDSNMKMKAEIANKYRSLDTLTDVDADRVLPEPGILDASKKAAKVVQRQNTYTTSPTRDLELPNIAIQGRTSSPLSSAKTNALSKFVEAEKMSDNLINLIRDIRKMYIDEFIQRCDSPPSYVMDVSKISQPMSIENGGLNTSNHSAKSGLPYASSPNLSRIPESRIQNTNNLKRVRSVSTCKISAPNLPKKSEIQKSNSLKRSIPKKLTSITSTISPSFGTMGPRKSFGLGSVLGNQISGTYKSLAGERASIGACSNLPREAEKKKTGLYSHIKPTITRYGSTKK